MECNRKTSTERCCCRKKSVIKKQRMEPVVGRNIHQRAWPCKGAELTPWLWTGGTREVRTQQWSDDPGRHGRFAAVDGWVHTRPCRTKREDVLFCAPKIHYFRTRYREMSIPMVLSSEIFIDETLKNPWFSRKKDLTI